MHRPLAVLGIDAAWSTKAASGVALLYHTATGWALGGVAPSYAQFLALAAGEPVNWSAPAPARWAEPRELLEAARTLARGHLVGCVAIDMPLATGPVTGRRRADDLVAAAFASLGHGTHSPRQGAPGRLATRVRAGFAASGFALATAATAPGTPRRLIEVYPGPTVARLLGSPYRVPYKVTRAARYWPYASSARRRALLAAEWRQIRAALATAIGGLSNGLPDPAGMLTRAAGKRYEDALDALVCAWVATRYLAGAATAYGDRTAAIWMPLTRAVPPRRGRRGPRAPSRRPP